MILYHGSNVEVKKPDLSYSRTSLDFGAAFYTTTDIEQAKKWAKRITKIRNNGTPLVSVFETGKEWQNLSFLNFASADKNWLSLVVKYRTGQKIEEKFDVISGPVANDRTVNVINQYIAGTFPEDIALQLLLPMKFSDQYALKTEKAVSAVTWKESISL